MAKASILLRINREGSFTVSESAQTPQQCGKVGQKEYRYFCSIEATNEHLTPEGYVMENAWVDEYFQATYNQETKAVPSCEQMAQDAITHILHLFARQPDLKKVQLTRILIRIHGSPVSFIEGEWKRPLLMTANGPLDLSGMRPGAVVEISRTEE